MASNNPFGEMAAARPMSRDEMIDDKINKLTRCIDSLSHDMEKLKSYVLAEDKAARPRGRSALSEKELMIKRAIEGEKHILLSGDFIKTRQLMVILRVIYPRNKMFPEIMFREVPAEVRKLGVNLSRIGNYENKLMGYYKPADRSKFQKGHRVNERVWVLRNFQEYADMTASDLYRAYEVESARVMKQYHAATEALGWKGRKGDVYPTAYGPHDEHVKFDEIDLCPINMTDIPRHRDDEMQSKHIPPTSFL